MTLYDAGKMSEGPVSVFNTAGKRAIEEMMFVDGDSQLLAITRDKIYHLSVPELTQTHAQSCDNPIYGQVREALYSFRHLFIDYH